MQILAPDSQISLLQPVLHADCPPDPTAPGLFIF